MYSQLLLLQRFREYLNITYNDLKEEHNDNVA